MTVKKKDLFEVTPKETVQTVTIWADRTFGAATIDAQFRRAQEEMKELDIAMASPFTSMAKIAEEAADVVICLYRLIGHCRSSAIDEKMAINRARQWTVNKEGIGYHKKGNDSCLSEQ